MAFPRNYVVPQEVLVSLANTVVLTVPSKAQGFEVVDLKS